VIPLQGYIFHRTSFNLEWVQRSEAFIGGPYIKSHKLKLFGKLAVITFKPGKAQFFIEEEISDLKESNILLSETWQDTASEFSFFENSRLRYEVLLRQMESLLQKQLRTCSQSKIRNEIELIHTNFCNSIENLACKSGYNVSYFRKLFYESIGLSPVQYLRIRRVNCFVEMYKKKAQRQPLTQLVHQLGYFDQSHFIRDFKDITGMSPKKYLSSINS
jgi:AraC-like DNA-binding protein